MLRKLVDIVYSVYRDNDPDAYDNVWRSFIATSMYDSGKHYTIIYEGDGEYEVWEIE